MSTPLAALPDRSILYADIHVGSEVPWKRDPKHPENPYPPEFPDKRSLGWFIEALGPEVERVFHWVDCTEELPPADLSRYQGVVIGGSSGSANDAEPWRQGVKAWYRYVVHPNLRVPVLGICGGHQLIAVALDGIVGPNHNEEREIGTRTVWFAPKRTLTGKTVHDPLFVDIASREGDTFSANFSHGERVVMLPAGAIELAHNAVGIQAYRLSDRATWGVQWHPEATAASVRRLVAIRKVDGVAGVIVDCPQGPRLLNNFFQYCADGGPLAFAGGVT